MRRATCKHEDVRDNERSFENPEIPAENLIGAEGQGFKYILDRLNAERTLIAAEYDVERRFRETSLYQAAPISTNLVLSYIAEHVPALRRSF